MSEASSHSSHQTILIFSDDPDRSSGLKKALENPRVAVRAFAITDPAVVRKVTSSLPLRPDNVPPNGIILFPPLQLSRVSAEHLDLVGFLRKEYSDIRIIVGIRADERLFEKRSPTGIDLLREGADAVIGFSGYDTARVASVVRRIVDGELSGRYHLEQERRKRAVSAVLPLDIDPTESGTSSHVTIHTRKSVPTTWDTRREKKRRSPASTSSTGTKSFSPRTPPDKKPLPPFPRSPYLSDIQRGGWNKIEATFFEKRIRLGERALALLAILSSREGEVFSNEKLMELLGHQSEAGLMLLINKTRDELKRVGMPECLKNRYREGYFFINPFPTDQQEDVS